MRHGAISGLVAAALSLGAAELKFDFGANASPQPPNEFRSLLYGEGQPGQWQVVMDEVAPRFTPLITQLGQTNRRPVLAQVSQDKTDERYPLLLYTKETFRDFTFSARVKMIGGEAEQMAGLVFRAQDEKNFYVLRANAKDGNVRFYTVKGGLRTQPIGNNLPVKTNHWHELKVECEGNRIRCFFDDQKIGDYFIDNTFREGKLGFWTKSDAQSYFADATVIYVPTEPLAQALVRDALKKYSRLLGLRISLVREGKNEPEIVASSDPKEVGQPGNIADKDILQRGTIYQQKTTRDVLVLMPLRDRNGDVVAVAHVRMDTFWGQTEKNAIARALPVVKDMQTRIQSAKDLCQ